MMYDSWDMERDRQNVFSSWAIFYRFTPVTAQKIKTSKEWKKHLEISSFNTSIPKIMIICFAIAEIWWMTDVILIFHFWPFFALFQKIKISKKWKTGLEISSFYTILPKTMIIGHTVLETWCMMDVIIFHFGLFFALLPPNSLKNENLKYEKRKSQKNEKKTWRHHHHFTQVYQKLWSYAILFLRYGTWHM